MDIRCKVIQFWKKRFFETGYYTLSRQKVGRFHKPFWMVGKFDSGLSQIKSWCINNSKGNNSIKISECISFLFFHFKFSKTKYRYFISILYFMIIYIKIVCSTAYYCPRGKGGGGDIPKRFIELPSIFTASAFSSVNQKLLICNNIQFPHAQ